MGYSCPVDEVVSHSTLMQHLYTLEDMPGAIPYVTSYYMQRWGFCLEYSKVRALDPEARYRVYIDSSLTEGSLTYADLVIPGNSEEEVLFSTYVCHPSMGNNELSGPIVNTFLAQWVAALPEREKTYRFVFIPETIGSLVYLSRHLEHLKANTVAGFNVSCVGDGRDYSFISSPDENTYADRVISHALKGLKLDHTKYSFLDRGSDERQYCSPKVNLPLITFCRSRFGTYPEYHTSLDNLDVISGEEMANSLGVLQHCVRTIEGNTVLDNVFCGEPQLGKRGLYPSTSKVGAYETVRAMNDLIAFANGTRDLLAIGEIIGVPTWELAPIARQLVEAGVLCTAIVPSTES
jgi:aminopeptidase-like protein